ncbi:PhzA/PhzB family protein [Pseudomonas aeruginosa]|uniref:PhzA/PhzB family protein n=1 Tax=Pseudomonas aeruginosa TaxID=287 RepID=UPI003982B4EE
MTDAAREKFLRHTWRALSEAAHERSAVQGNTPRHRASAAPESRHGGALHGNEGGRTVTAAQPVRRGRLRRQLDHGKRRTPGFPDWEWHNVRIFETEDPNHFWVECDGRGKALVPGYPQGYCENHYIHSFELENGRIKRNREFMNPIQKLRALGIAVPQIKRDGIPT